MTCHLPSIVFLACSLVCAARLQLFAADDPAGEADKAWKEVQRAWRPPPQPEEWRTTKPTAEERARFHERQAKLAGEAADKAKDFYVRFSKHDRADEARKKEYEMTSIAVRLGDSSRAARLEELDRNRLNDPSLGEDERFQLRVQAVQRDALSKREDGVAVMLAEYEKGARALQKDFPKRGEAYGILLEVAANNEGGKARQHPPEVHRR